MISAYGKLNSLSKCLVSRPIELSFENYSQKSICHICAHVKGE
jgi:hypothetical protein